MALVKIKFAPTFGVMLTADKANDWIQQGKYTNQSHVFHVFGEGQDAADEVFDLTNNPSRQDERIQVYGQGRSLSSGDIVVVGTMPSSEEQWLCMSFGWARL